MGNPLLLALYSLVPRGIWVVVLLAALVVFCVDLVGTLLAMAGLRYRWPAAAAVENRLANLTVRGGMWILDHVERRMAKAIRTDLCAPQTAADRHVCRRVQPV